MNITSSIRNYDVSFEVSNFKEDFFLIDRSVYNLHKNKIHLNPARIILIDASEITKSFDKCSEHLENLLFLGVKRGKTIGVIGGGVLQDMAGFLCGILYRGVSWNFYPTTLLAQCDSCIGGKTSINFKSFKNIIGTFNPPQHINIDVEFLNTLHSQEIQSGIGEIIKIAFLDPEQRIDYSDIIEVIETEEVPVSLIKMALLIKKEIIEIDEFDKNLRNIMNYGHTFGHAIESITDFAIPHGIAVGIGISIANNISEKLYGTDISKMDKVLKSYLIKNSKYLGVFREACDLHKFFLILSKDKKNIDNNSITCILTKAAGNMFKVNIGATKLKLILKEINNEN